MSRRREAPSSLGQTADLRDDHLRKQIYGHHQLNLVLFSLHIQEGCDTFSCQKQRFLADGVVFAHESHLFFCT